MSFDSRLLESLLHQVEGPALDFKQERYPFENASVGQKAELLKDILAMANSWRLTTAYILIGVREVKGGRSEIVGIEDHLDDADLHQFVNGKTQRPVEFSYIPYHTQGLEIGVIEIPIQERPLFLTNRFANLRHNQVFVRDGSSTRIATPDEIARMGAEQVLGGRPQFLLEWSEVRADRARQSIHSVHSLVLEPFLPPHTFSRRRPGRLGINPFANPDYSRDTIAGVADRRLLTGLGFRLQNESSTVGRRIRFSGRITKWSGLVIQEWIDSMPSRDRNFLHTPILDMVSRDNDDPKAEITEMRDSWEVVVDFGDVRPRDEVWSDTVLYAGSTRPGAISLRGELRGDNLPEPVKCELELHINVDRRPMTIDDVVPYLA